MKNKCKGAVNHIKKTIDVADFCLTKVVLSDQIVEF